MSCYVKFFKDKYQFRYGTVYVAKTVDKFGNVGKDRYGRETRHVPKEYRDQLYKHMQERGYRVWEDTYKSVEDDNKKRVPCLKVTIKNKADKVQFTMLNVGVIEIPEPRDPEPLEVYKI